MCVHTDNVGLFLDIPFHINMQGLITAVISQYKIILMEGRKNIACYVKT